MVRMWCLEEVCIRRNGLQNVIFIYFIQCRKSPGLNAENRHHMSVSGTACSQWGGCHLWQCHPKISMVILSISRAYVAFQSSWPGKWEWDSSLVSKAIKPRRNRGEQVYRALAPLVENHGFWFNTSPSTPSSSRSSNSRSSNKEKKIKQKHKNTKLLKPKQAKLILNILFSKKFCFGLWFDLV